MDQIQKGGSLYFTADKVCPLDSCPKKGSLFKKHTYNTSSVSPKLSNHYALALGSINVKRCLSPAFRNRSFGSRTQLADIGLFCSRGCNVAEKTAKPVYFFPPSGLCCSRISKISSWFRTHFYQPRSG